MGKIIETIKQAFVGFGLSEILTIIIVAAIIYYTLAFLKRNNALKLSISFITLILIIGLIFIVNDIDGGIYLLFVTMLLILIFTVFSFELKRDIWDNKKGKPLDYKQTGGNDSEAVDRCVSEIIKALQNMSKNDIGAIIILSSGNVPPQILESGVILDSDISSQIIESVFFPKSPLHDGAMIINGQKIQAAGCFLPLSQEVNLPKELGTRHRAGIGITEALNVTALIVSEETGIISIAKSGKIKRYADADMLKNTLKNFYWQAYLVSDKKRRD
jgi:diadenylate cyclase